MERKGEEGRGRERKGEEGRGRERKGEEGRGRERKGRARKEEGLPGVRGSELVAE